MNDVRALTEVAHRHGAADRRRRGLRARSGPLPQDEWGVDVVVAGSQKALMAPPGLGFASRTRRRSSARPASAGPRATTSTGSARSRASARTRRTARSRRPSRLFRALDVALEDDRGRGPRGRLRAPRAARPRRARGGQGARPGDLRSEDENANVVTAVRVPEGVDGAKIPKMMRDTLRHHDRRRAGPAQGQDPPDRPLRLLRRLRHHRVGRGARDGAATTSARGRARRRRRRRAAASSQDAGVPPAQPA